MICAGEQGKLIGFCDGDDGGPLMCKKYGTIKLYGIASWQLNPKRCGSVPQVFSNVRNITNWIYQISKIYPQEIPN